MRLFAFGRRFGVCVIRPGIVRDGFAAPSGRPAPVAISRSWRAASNTSPGRSTNPGWCSSARIGRRAEGLLEALLHQRERMHPERQAEQRRRAPLPVGDGRDLVADQAG